MRNVGVKGACKGRGHFAPAGNAGLTICVAQMDAFFTFLNFFCLLHVS